MSRQAECCGGQISFVLQETHYLGRHYFVKQNQNAGQALDVTYGDRDRTFLYGYFEEETEGSAGGIRASL